MKSISLKGIPGWGAFSGDAVSWYHLRNLMMLYCLTYISSSTRSLTISEGPLPLDQSQIIILSAHESENHSSWQMHCSTKICYKVTNSVQNKCNMLSNEKVGISTLHLWWKHQLLPSFHILISPTSTCHLINQRLYNIGSTVSCISRRLTCMTFLFGSRQISQWVVYSCLKHTTKWGNWLFSTMGNIQEQAIVKTDLWLLENAPSTMTPWPLPLSCCQQWPVRIIVSSQTYLKTDFLRQYFRP